MAKKSHFEEVDNIVEPESVKIDVLKGLEGVRRHTTMYLGSTGSDGQALHQILYEAIDNSADEAYAAFCDQIHVIIHADNSVTVRDNGRGIPTDKHETEDMSQAKLAVSTLHAGGKFHKSSTAGTHGVGIAASNAVSSKFRLLIKQNGKEYELVFYRGIAEGDIKVIGTELSINDHGTSITMWPDTEIFEFIVWDADRIIDYLRKLAALISNLTCVLIDERSGKVVEHTFHYPDGIAGYLRDIVVNQKSILPEIIFFTGVHSKHNISFEVAIQWVEDVSSDNVKFFTNTILQNNGGVHHTAFFSSLTRVVNTILKENHLAGKQKVDISGSDIKEGIVVVFSLRMQDPRYASQMKDKLVSTHVRVIEPIIHEKLYSWFLEHPMLSKTLIQKFITAFMAREAAKKAKELVKKKDDFLDGTVVTKLSGCRTKDPSLAELILVEGDSAAGGVKKGRNPLMQAVLPFKGKPLNAEKASVDQLFKSEELRVLATVLGTGMGDRFDIDSLKYHTVIILTDPDSDGDHISCLLFTFFLREMRPLLKHGRVFVGRAPLYKVTYGGANGKIEYYNDKESLDKAIIQRGSSALQLIHSVSGESNNLTGSKLVSLVQSCAKFNECLDIISQNQGEFRLALEQCFIRDVFSDFSPETIQRALEKVIYLSPEGRKNWEMTVHDGVLRIRSTVRSVVREFNVDSDFLIQNDVRVCLKCAKRISQYFDIGELQLVYKNKDVVDIHSPLSLVSLIFENGSKNLVIVWFKGLGELNPDQLWDCVINPDTRVLWQLNIDDEAKTDELCNILMGKRVAPRKEFIDEFLQKKIAEIDVSD